MTIPVFLKKAFTLIELLIVVAIIAVLAVIALPNFLEAQTRAKVTRLISDMRAVSVTRAYRIDNKTYPRFPTMTTAAAIWGSRFII